ncbi:MAG: hypothetical protein M3N43_14500, partial [Actinomycetota bacterium]|nr:hypothetical protein [Actinomycetota bacterium]
MPTVLAVVLALAMVPWSPTLDVETGTVRLLVPEDTALGLWSAEEAGSSASGWQQIEVPIRGTV